jgi:hypothetical protein
MVSFWGGINDIARNASSNGVTHIMKFLMRNQHTNIINKCPSQILFW